MIPGLLAGGVVFIAATAAHAIDGAPQQVETIAFACTGTMIAGGAESRIVSGGTVDFVKMRVNGFGIGSVPIRSAPAAELRFGSSLLSESDGVNTIEGSIDRTTGRTSIVVRSSRAPASTLIAMELDCRITPPVL